jgi:hydroxymethylpyrimidine/phosphomethylpyrimidine kinase
MHPPVAMTIAGSDNSAGAGIQADLKTFTHFGVYGQTVVTCVVAEIPGKVVAVQAIDESVIEDQCRLSLNNFPVASIKTGMLFSAGIVDRISSIIENIHPRRRPPLIVDPVMLAGAGNSLLQKEAIELYIQRLIPLATLVTPNLDEAATLVGKEILSLDEMTDAAHLLFARFRVPFLLKGGHLVSVPDLAPSEAVDLLIDSDGVHAYSAPFHRGIPTHGTGCTYSAAIAANLALGRSLRSATEESKRYITQAIARSFQWEFNGGKTCALRHLL